MRLTLTQPCQRQHARTRQPLHIALHLAWHIDGPICLRQLRAHALLQLLYQAIGGQAVDGEQLIIFDHLVFLLKTHQQTMAQKAAGGVAQKVRQPCQRQRHLGVRFIRCHLRQHLRLGLLVGRMPFAGKGGQARSLLEIAAAERLQRVLPGALLQQIPLIALPALGQIVAQLRNQYRRRLLAVVAYMAARPADVEPAPGRQQGIEHKLAIIVAPCTVARALLARLGHQVEVHARGAARIVAVIHAQQADHLKRNGAHGHQRAKGHTARAKALVECRLGQGL